MEDYEYEDLVRKCAGEVDRQYILHGMCPGIGHFTRQVIESAVRVACASKRTEMIRIFAKEMNEIEQVLAKVLGYPEAYPHVSEMDDGAVVVAPELPIDVANKAADRIRELEVEYDMLKSKLTRTFHSTKCVYYQKLDANKDPSACDCGGDVREREIKTKE